MLNRREPRAELRTPSALRMAMYSQVIASCPDHRRGDASAGSFTCECGGRITYAREERTGDLRAECSRPGCFVIGDQS